MERTNEGPGARKEYRRPMLKKVPLRPDEAVLGGCKSANSGNLNLPGPPTTTCSIPTNCSTIAS